jgi:hypothetical protein
MRKLLIAATFLAGLSPAFEAFNMGDADSIVDASRSNELRFNRDYKGQPFSDVVTFHSLTQQLFTPSRWSVDLNGVYCEVDSDAASRMIDWRKGQRIRVTGVIYSTTLGDIWLKDCRFQ